MSGSFIFTQFLINRMLLKPQENGFNTEISTTSVHNLYVLAALIHGIYSEVMYDTFKSNLIQQRILLPDQSNRQEILHNFIYGRYKYMRKLPKMSQFVFAFSDVIDDSSQ